MAAPPLDQQAPAAPLGPVARVSAGGGVRLAWNASGDNVGVDRLPGLPRRRRGRRHRPHLLRGRHPVRPGPHVYTVYAAGRRGQPQRRLGPVHRDGAELGQGRGPARWRRWRRCRWRRDPGPTGTRGFEPRAGDGRGPVIRLARKRMRGGRLRAEGRGARRRGVARLTLRIDGRRVRARAAPGSASAGGRGPGATAWWCVAHRQARQPRGVLLNLRIRGRRIACDPRHLACARGDGDLGVRDRQRRDRAERRAARDREGLRLRRVDRAVGDQRLRARVRRADRDRRAAGGHARPAAHLLHRRRDLRRLLGARRAPPRTSSG